MSSVLSLSPETPLARWRTPLLMVAMLWLGLFALYWPTFMSMVDIWDRSETYTHGFLIFPISFWLLWRNRARVAALPIVPDWRALPLMLLTGAGWVLAQAGGVLVVSQYAFVTLLILSVWAVLGWRVLWALFFPFLFLYFSVPVGEVLIPKLMTFTANFTVAAIKLTSLPVYQEGTFFYLPGSEWSVVEGCSGLRYLISAFTLSCLYAYLTYRTPWRRAAFAVAGLVVPVFANGLRAFTIVMIAYLSDMKLALGIDHYIYGWVFFGFVMLILFWVGTFWREDLDEEKAESAPAKAAAPPPALPPGRYLGVAALAVLVGFLWPAYARHLDDKPVPVPPALMVVPAGGWQPVAPFTDWQPHWEKPSQQWHAYYAKDGHQVMLEIDYYATQKQGSELITTGNYFIHQKDPVWSNVGQRIKTVRIGAQTDRVLVGHLHSHAQHLLIWQWNDIDGRRVMNDYEAKLILAWKKVRGHADDGASVIIATPCDDKSDCSAVLEDFAQAMTPAIRAAIAREVGQ